MASYKERATKWRHHQQRNTTVDWDRNKTQNGDTINNATQQWTGRGIKHKKGNKNIKTNLIKRQS
jgi:hypothetical protein